MVWLFAAAVCVRAEGSSSTSGAGSPGAAWKTTVSLTVREGFDSNVFLQNTTPSPAISNAAAPGVESFVTAIAVPISMEYRPAPGFTMVVSYAPESSTYHSASSENNIVHPVGLNFSGQAGATKWSLLNTATWIDGSKVGPAFGCTGGVTGMGGIPLRDRRAAFFGRSSFKLTQPFGAGWFIRPVATAYAHNFLTQQRHTAGYENYVDRQELVGGADLAYEVVPKAWLVAGYRYGRQDQFKLFGLDSPYDSHFSRFLAGFEGTPAKGLQLNILAGPEVREFAPGTAVGFSRHTVRLWIDASATLTPNPGNSFTLAVRRYEQPAFSSLSVYEDITYEISWSHKFNDRISTGAGFKAYGGEWLSPANRQDWIFTPSALLRCVVNRRCSVELKYSYDRAESRVPVTPGREYLRHLTSVATRLTF